MNTRNVTNTAFVSYPATGVQLPNGRQLANTYDALYRRTLVHDQTNGVDVAAWQFFGPSRVAEVALGNGLICSWMDNARTNSAVQPSVANPAWGDQSSDRLGYDGTGRSITKRYLAGGINGSTHAYNNPSAVVGFTTEYDLASNKFYERHLHAAERSHLYEPFSNGAPTGGYDSVNRLRQYKRGVLTSNDGFAAAGGGSVTTPSSLPNTDTQRTYDLDSLGNWRRTIFTPEGVSQETEVRQHNGLNEITRIQNGASQTNLTYDGAPGTSNGNLKNDGTRSYTWDALNRLVQVNRVSDNAVIGQYVYDIFNRRIRKTVSNGGLSGTIPNGTTDCVYSGWRCVEERNPFGGGGSTDTPTSQYIWGIYLDKCLQQRLLVALDNFAANSDLYPLQDLLYRTTGLADSSGLVREAYDTDAYGNTLIFRNSGTPPSPIAFSDGDTQVGNPTCPFIFTGQRIDAETQSYYYKRRYYLATFGRFISRDPIQNELATYVYCRSRPLTDSDPFGLDGAEPNSQQNAGGTNCPDPVCGPDVTKALIAVLKSVKTTYQGWSKQKQADKCKDLGIWGSDPINAWDIFELHNTTSWTQFAPGKCATPKSCKETVQVGPDCFRAASVNYVLFGVMTKLCGYTKTEMTNYVSTYKGPFGLFPSTNWPGSTWWALAGYNGWPNAAPPDEEMPKCFPTCSVPYSGTFTFKWGPNKSTSDVDERAGSTGKTPGGDDLGESLGGD